MLPIPASPLEVVQAAFLLGIFVEPLDHPSCMGQAPTPGASLHRYSALPTTWQLPILPSMPEYCAAPPTDSVPFLGNPVSSKTSTPLFGGWMTSRRLTRASSRASASQVASLSECCKSSVERPTTAAAMVSAVLCGRSVSRPVR